MKMKMKMKNRKEHAVSEVVGVLLMLTVTVIIAATVALVASNSMDDQSRPVTSNVVAIEADEGNVILELVSGDSFSLDGIKVRLGIREDGSTYTILERGINDDINNYLESYTSDRTITVGDKFKIKGTVDGMFVKFGEFAVKKGQHLSYSLYDSANRPFSSGEIKIK